MNLFGYFDIGRRAMSAFRLNMAVAGDNIANATTPGYARRRVELVPGLPVRVPGGWLDSGVDAARIARMEDRFLQAGLDRETGGLGEADQRLRGLSEIEAVFGELSGAGISDALAQFAAAFHELAGQPESSAQRLSAVAAADQLAGSIRDAYGRLRAQRVLEDQAVRAEINEINALAEQLTALNVEIRQAEADGSIAAALRDRRTQVIQDLAERTGGIAVDAGEGVLGFELPAGTTLVSGLSTIPLQTAKAADGTARVLAGGDGSDVTDRLRRGRLGGLLHVRDTALPATMTSLDTLAGDLIGRANAITAGALDLAGNPGVPLFTPAAPGGAGVAGKIAVNAALLQNPQLLAVSTSGAPGDGAAAALLAALESDPSAALGDRSATAYLIDLLGGLGTEIAQADVSRGVAEQLIASMTAKRDAVSGVSLDEEAVELMRSQRAFEAAAKFLQTIDEMTQETLNLFQ